MRARPLRYSCPLHCRTQGGCRLYFSTARWTAPSRLGVRRPQPPHRPAVGAMAQLAGMNTTHRPQIWMLLGACHQEGTWSWGRGCGDIGARGVYLLRCLCEDLSSTWLGDNCTHCPEI